MVFIFFTLWKRVIKNNQYQKGFRHLISLFAGFGDAMPVKVTAGVI